MTSEAYSEFLARKRPSSPAVGFSPRHLNPHLLDWQALIVDWACRRGRAGIWLDCGLGKSIIQLSWADQVCRATGGDVLILTPLAVARQMQREGAKFGIEVHVGRSQSDVRPGINVTNYQMLGKYDPSHFVGASVDESDILANFTGKTKREILSAFERTRYKLDNSATPAPNDHLELGNHADFLGVMESNEMISRWFINDLAEAGVYRLKRHAEGDFWRWVAGWATAMGRPSDLGYPDGGFALPPLDIREHVVEVDSTDGAEPGFMFRLPSMSATSMHKEMRRTSDDRAGAVADIERNRADRSSPFLAWCNTDYEADALKAAMPHAVEVRGSESVDAKEEKIEAFALGRVPVLVSKPSICGHGLNLQVCREMAFTGLSYSYKQFYQAVRRCWRYGQTSPVTAHVVMAETEGRVLETIRRKQAAHETMKAAMVASMRRFGLGADSRRDLSGYSPAVPMTLPAWMENAS